MIKSLFSRKIHSALFVNHNQMRFIQNQGWNHFCSQKPGGKDSEPEIKKSSDNEQKFKFVKKKETPLQKIVESKFLKNINKNFNLNVANRFFRAGKNEKKDQKGNEDNEDQNAGYRKILNLITFLLASLLLFPSNSERPKIGNDDFEQFNPVNIQTILKDIETSPPTQVLVTKKFYEPISILVIFSPVRMANFKTNEAGLVYFLERLENINSGQTPVEFKFNNSLPKKKKFKFIKILDYAIIGCILFLGYRFFKKVGQSMDVSKMMNMKKFEPIKPENIQIFFKDVAGMHEAKFEVTEFVDFLKKPEKYIEMGAKVPKGALLTGPPGTGKTLLAKACAGEAGVPFFSVSGSDFVEKYSGLGASRVRSLFDEAEKNSPSIIFIDEIDAIGKKRDSGPFSNEERDNTLNQLLVRMDGFDTKNKVIVMAATNRKDMLDPALLRPGRFDRAVEIGLPNMEERQEILKVHLKKVKFDPNITEEELAKKISIITPGFSGAELANTCNEAAILAARENLSFIPLSKFEKATERVMAGLEKRNIFTEEEKEMLSFYECGKAVAGWFTEGSDPVIKISILPFSKSGSGFSHSIKDETALHTKDELLDKICCYLAGRTAEEHFKGYITTNGDKDLERAKRIITMIVTKFGMSQSLNKIAFPDYDFTRKPYSEKVESLIDEEAEKILNQCKSRVDQLIKEKEKEILILKEELLKKQTLTHNCIKDILGDRPFSSNENYQKFLKDQETDQPDITPGPGVGAGTQ